jgi:hypothetical protein
MLSKSVAVASDINNYFIKKVKDIISGIPRVNMDPLTKLREQMVARRCTFTLWPVTEEVVKQFIKQTKPTTATGVDYIDNRTLKLVTNEITPALTHIINLNIYTVIFPSIYKWSKVTPLLIKTTIDPILQTSKPACGSL